jgi:hypothetical protein
MWKLPSPTWPTIGASRPSASAAARRSRLLVALLWVPFELDAGGRGLFGAALAERDFRLVRVASSGDLAGAAASLARALSGPRAV